MLSGFSRSASIASASDVFEASDLLRQLLTNCVTVILIERGLTKQLALHHEAEVTNIVGRVIAEGLVEVNGQIEGELHCTSLIISRKAHVAGTIKAERVVVDGASRARLKAEALF